MRLLISTGDFSGELYGRALAERLLTFNPAIELFSLAEGLLEQVGAVPVSRGRSAQVVGMAEVFREGKRLSRLFRDVLRFFARRPPHVVVLIDYAEFNLQVVARLARAKGCKVIYFIPPQVWAWRSSRLRLLKRLVDELVVILPFEEQYYRSRGISRVAYFGHPLVDRITTRQYDTPPHHEKLLVGVFPGSRRSEWDNHLPIIHAIVERCEREGRPYVFWIPVTPTIATHIADIPLHPALHLIYDTPTASAAQQVLERAQVALIASGTATLEAAIVGVPMVVFYRVSPLSALVGRLLLSTPFISLPNLICGREVVPEFVQYFDLNALTEAVHKIVSSTGGGCPSPRKSATPPRSALCGASQKAAFEELRRRLGTPPHTSQR